jgi:hypothetical protein
MMPYHMHSLSCDFVLAETGNSTGLWGLQRYAGSPKYDDIKCTLWDNGGPEKRLSGGPHAAPSPSLNKEMR